LFYRLKVLDLHLPPLRERREEIPDLVGLFIRQLNPRMGVDITDITPRAMEALIAYEWRGNIRELRNFIERAMLFCDEDTLDLQHLPPEITEI
jgi:DNA-binding NtrC family response regulator